MYEILMVILGISGVLNVLLFFKIWGMTDNVKDIKEILENSRERKKNKTKTKFIIGDHVIAKSYDGVLEIIDIYEDGTYNCISVETNEIVGDFKENELTKKK